MLQAGRLPACLHGLAGNGVWLLSLNLKEVERAVRDLRALPPCTCTRRSDLTLEAIQLLKGHQGSQQPELAHHASLCHVVLRWPWASAARKQLCLTLAHPGLQQPHTAAAAGQCSGILSGCSLPRTSSWHV